MDLAQKIARITDFTVICDGCADLVNTAERGFKQKFWHGLRILNYFAYGLSFSEDNFTDHDLTVNNCGSADFGLNLHGMTDLHTPIHPPNIFPPQKKLDVESLELLSRRSPHIKHGMSQSFELPQQSTIILTRSN